MDSMHDRGFIPLTRLRHILDHGDLLLDDGGPGALTCVEFIDEDIAELTRDLRTAKETARVESLRATGLQNSINGGIIQTIREAIRSVQNIEETVAADIRAQTNRDVALCVEDLAASIEHAGHLPPDAEGKPLSGILHTLRLMAKDFRKGQYPPEPLRGG